MNLALYANAIVHRLEDDARAVRLLAAENAAPQAVLLGRGMCEHFLLLHCIATADDGAALAERLRPGARLDEVLGGSPRAYAESHGFDGIWSRLWERANVFVHPDAEVLEGTAVVTAADVDALLQDAESLVVRAGELRERARSRAD